MSEADADDIEIVEVRVAIGTHVQVGDAVVEVATDKANMEVSSPYEGVVVEIFVSAGDVVDGSAALVALES